MNLAELSHEVGDFMRGNQASEKGTICDLPGLYVFECSATTRMEPLLYNPVACLTLQGAKEAVIGGKTQLFRPGETVIVSHDLPATACITDASASAPYRSLVLMLDLTILRSLDDEIGDAALDETQGSAVAANQADEVFVETLARYFMLVKNPIEAQVMAPLIQKELHFRLLMAPHGRMLRRLLHLDSHASRISRAIVHIRQHFREALTVADLARVAGMGSSAFHAHFRAITETTPLQYQKELRLIEARRLMSEEGVTVSAAAFKVGYESPTQFSREFARKFGAPPSRHLQFGDDLPAGDRQMR